LHLRPRQNASPRQKLRPHPFQSDKALFGYTTEQMKRQWKVPKSRALADFAPTIVLKAKDFAAEITIFNAKVNRMQTEQEISGEHITNNASVRNTLIERGIRPERLPQAQKSARPRPGA